MFQTFHDCNKTLWPWQERGIDDESHRSCHRRRVELYRASLKESGDAESLAMLEREVREIEHAYSLD